MPSSWIRVMLLAIRCCCGRSAADALERGAERERAAVADLGGDRADRRAGLAQKVRGERDPPAGEEVIGGSPTRSLKRRASAARETPAARASSAPSRGPPGVVQHAQGGPDDRVGVGPIPRGRLGLGTREPRAQDGDQQQVEQAVEHGLLARARP